MVIISGVPIFRILRYISNIQVHDRDSVALNLNVQEPADGLRYLVQLKELGYEILLVIQNG